MKYAILKQFIPGNDQIWVEKLDADDSSYAFDTLQEAVVKIDELQLVDPTRRFKIVEKD